MNINYIILYILDIHVVFVLSRNNYLSYCSYFGKQYYKVLDRNFLCIEKVFLRFNFAPSFTKGKNKIYKGENLRDIEKIEVQKLYSTSCQNNSAIGNFTKRLCTCHISMAISIDQISFETKQKSTYKVDFNFLLILIKSVKQIFAYFFLLLTYMY